MFIRNHIGQYLAWPYEHVFSDAYRITERMDPRQDRGRLEDVVAAARASLVAYSVDDQAPVKVIELVGTGYERGYAMGAVLKDDVIANVQNMMRVADTVAWPGQLEAKWREFEAYVPREYVDELRGLADGSGVSLKLLRRMHAIPEITEQTCSGWAINNGISQDGHSYHVRILDYATYFRVQEHPLVAIHRPTDRAGNPTGNAVANIAWVGFEWSVGGVNEHGLAIGEISGGQPDEVSGERGDGEPMSALIRRTLAQAKTVDDASAIIRGARRTMRYAYVLSDWDTSAKILSGPEFFQSYDEGDAVPQLGRAYDAFPGFPQLMYHGYHGANHEKHIARFTDKHDNLTFDDIREHARAVALRKNLQLWVYDREAQELWLGNAVGVKGRAVDQPLTRIPLAQHWR